MSPKGKLFDTRTIAVRDVKPGDTLLRKSRLLKVASATFRDGTDGREIIFASGRDGHRYKTKVAIEITFTTGETILGYPSDPVELVPATSQ